MILSFIKCNKNNTTKAKPQAVVNDQLWNQESWSQDTSKVQEPRSRERSHNKQGEIWQEIHLDLLEVFYTIEIRGCQKVPCRSEALLEALKK